MIKNLIFMGQIFLPLSMVAIVLFVVLRIVNKKNGRKSSVPIVIAITGGVLFASALTLFVLSYHMGKKNFRSFDLTELKRQEFIIQTIEFKKFLMNGTEGEGGKHTDEMQVYHISGRAEVSFTDIENLAFDEEASDINAKIMRFKYDNPKRQIPFAINVIIEEKDINQVTRFESEKINIFGLYKKDLVKPDMTQGQIVEVCKEELKKEFERQIIDATKTSKLEESDIYQTFIEQLTQVVTELSDWESVEIKFVNK